MDNLLVVYQAQLGEVQHHCEEILSRLDEVSTCISRDGATVLGSKAQIRGHPLLTVERELRRDLVRLREVERGLQVQLEDLREDIHRREAVERINAGLRRHGALATIGSRDAAGDGEEA